MADETKTPGILQKFTELLDDQSSSSFQERIPSFHDEFNALPLRSGVHYRSIDPGTDDDKIARPRGLTIYEVSNTSAPEIQEFLTRASVRPPGDSITAELRSYNEVLHWEAQDYTPSARNVANKEDGRVLVSLSVVLKPERKGIEVERWYIEEHMPLISKVHGWQRTRLFKPTKTTGEDAEEFLTLHEYRLDNGLKSAEFQAAVSTPWAQDMQLQAPQHLSRSLYTLQA